MIVQASAQACSAAAAPGEAATAPAPSLVVMLAGPRGFCAGVERAILIVERLLAIHGPPVYVRHEIVHNRFVVETLAAKGVVFVAELDEVPDDRPVVFSAHGVAKSVAAEAARRTLLSYDATCPLVSKVHAEATHHHLAGRTVLLIGHARHPEVVGTMGQLPDGAVILVEGVSGAETVRVDDPSRLAYVTQTTLSADDTAATVAVLRRRFPAIRGPRREDICYATTNRQQAVKAIARRVEALLVVGAPNSSNATRLVEVAKTAGCPRARLIQRASEIDWSFLAGTERLGLTAGASTPELLVEEVIEACRERFAVTLETVSVTEEHVRFNLPRALAV